MVYNVYMIKKQKQNAGFTLIELLVGVFVFGILSIAIANFSSGILKNSSRLRENLSSQTNIRKAFNNFTSEIRSASPSWDGTYIIEMASSTALTFYSNIDSDKYTEKIRYFISGTKLNKGITKFNINTSSYDLPETISTIAININATSTTRVFTYYDKNYDGTASYPKIPDPVDTSVVRLIRFDLSNNPYGVYLNAPDSSSVQVSLRNLKDNY